MVPVVVYVEPGWGKFFQYELKVRIDNLEVA